MPWYLRRITAEWSAPLPLWHYRVGIINGYYITACGLRYTIAGASSKLETPAGACVKCLRHEARVKGEGEG